MNTCEQCGTEYQPKERPRANRPSRYCSRACSHEAQRTLVSLTCRQCGVEFRRKAYMADWSTERGPFCGFGCYGAWQTSQLPKYGGVWKRARLAALERDAHRCRDCGKTHRRLLVHHVRPVAEFSDQSEAHAVANLRTLCPKCHHLAHA